MDYLSVCSGIEAASVAWHGIAQPVGFAEIAAFPSAVLAHRFPTVPNLGDMTTIAARLAADEIAAPSILVGGTPCQAFSFAGLRESMDDARGRLALSFVGIANEIDASRFVRRLRPAAVVWENVPGCLATKDNAFGCFVGALAGRARPVEQPGRRWPNAGFIIGPRRVVAWRVFDAQHFGLPQRRARVFVIASAIGGPDPAAILFECASMRRNTAAGGNAQGGATACGVAGGPAARGQWDVDASGQLLTVGTLCADTHPGAYSGQDAYTGHLVPVFGPDGPIAVRRLLPVERERLQGFPDDWTNVPWRGKPTAPDSLRCQAIGNAMAVPVMRWIGVRIKRVNDNAQFVEPVYSL